MHLREITIRNLRNWEEISFEFSPHLNAFVGNNGEGKTNCLEAISLLTSFRPLHHYSNSDLLRHGSQQSYLSGQLMNEQASLLELFITQEGKKARLDQKPISRHSKLCEKLCKVSFVPADMQIITQGAAHRRKFVDQVAFSLRPSHADTCRDYEKLVSARNQILKVQGQRADLLEIYTNLLIDKGSDVILNRLFALEQLRPFLKDALETIDMGSLNTQLIYGPISYVKEDGPLQREEIEAKLRASFKENGSKEKIRRMTLSGPHLDDLFLKADGLFLKNCLSRGQARTVVLAFKLAQMKAIYETRKMAPILLLDDVVSELDDGRMQNLLSYIQKIKAQIFMTCIEPSHFRALKPECLFELKQGRFCETSSRFLT